MSARIAVEVVFATPGRQCLIELEVAQGARIADVLTESKITDEFPDVDLDSLQVGIWGNAARRDDIVRAGDRVEIYRPLEMDPRDARRLRVKDSD